jgi:hypothetical protein
MNKGDLTGTLVTALVILIVLLLVLREVVCWYWKINQNLALLTEIRDLLAASRSGSAALAVSASSSAIVAAPPPSKVARNEAIIQRLAERVRDNPRLPIDEKIDLLQHLGGRFSWERGNACLVNYKGQELTFAGGREFGDWLSSNVLPEILRRADT